MVDIKEIKKNRETWLSGMGEITSYVNRSAPTVLKLIKTSGFPAKKLNGVWESSTVLIDKWREGLILDE
jgi:hypothetical protein